MELTVYNINGQETSRKITLESSIFDISPNDHAIYLDVKQYMANKRQGTHKTKDRSEIKATTKKLKRQKGTGSARAGDMKSPVFVGGGRVFGPDPKDYNFKLNKKLKRLARKSAFSYKAKENSIIIVEDFTFDKPETKSYVKFLKNFNVLEKKSLLVLKENDKNLYLSARNIPKAKITTVSAMNTYEILNSGRLILQESTITEIEKWLADEKKEVITNNI